MKTSIAKPFSKQWKKLPESVQEKFKGKRNIFLINRFAIGLNGHELNGKYENCGSFNVTEDYRVIYQNISDNLTEFTTIGTHSQLYG